MSSNLIKIGIGPFIGGVVFALGLGISGMTEPAKVIGFLNLFGEWDPSLAFVMVGAICVNTLLHRLITKKPSPLFDSKFHLPNKTTVDKKLILGAALFGVGWGVTGLCPGPGLASLATGKPYALAFVAALIIGIVAAKAFLKINVSKES